MNKHLIVLLSGLTGSGKTYLYALLKSKFDGFFKFTHHEWVKGTPFGLFDFASWVISKPGNHFIVVENPYGLPYKTDPRLAETFEVIHLFLDGGFNAWLFNIHRPDRILAYKETFTCKLDLIRHQWGLSAAEGKTFCTEGEFKKQQLAQWNTAAATVDARVSLDDALQLVSDLAIKIKRAALADFLSESTKKYPAAGNAFTYQGFDFGHALCLKGASKTDVKWKLLSLDKLDFKDKSVVDIGCNIGMYSYKAFLSGASRILGLEQDARNFEAASFLRDTFFQCVPIPRSKDSYPAQRFKGADFDYTMGVKENLYQDTPIEYVHDSFWQHDFKDETFDYVFVIAVLHHMANFDTMDEVVKKISKICRGMAVIEVAERVHDPRVTKDFIWDALKRNFEYAYWAGESIGHKFNDASARHIFHCYNHQTK